MADTEATSNAQARISRSAGTVDSSIIAIGIVRDGAFLVRIFGDRDWLAESFELAERGDGGAPLKSKPAGAASHDLDEVQCKIDEETRNRCEAAGAHRDMLFPRDPSRVYSSMQLRSVGSGGPVTWAKKAGLHCLAPSTPEEFVQNLSFDVRRNVDAETILFTCEQVLKRFTTAKAPIAEDLLGYAVNTFVIWAYKRIELDRATPDETSDAIRDFAYKTLDSIKEGGEGVRFERYHVYASLRTAMWHLYVFDGDYEAAEKSLNEIYRIYCETKKDEKFPVSRAFNFCISMLVHGLMLAAQGRSEEAKPVLTATVQAYRRAVATGTKNVTWFAELGVSHAAAAAAFNINDRLTAGRVPLDVDYLFEMGRAGPRIHTAAFNEAFRHMIRVLIARSGVCPLDRPVAMAQAERGVLRPTPGVLRSATFELNLIFDGQAPDRVQLRFQQAGGYRVVDVVVTPAMVDANARRVALAFPLSPDHPPFSAIRVFSAAPGERLVEVAYAEDYDAKNLFFFSRRAFERVFFVRRRRAKDNSTLVFAAEQICSEYRLSKAHQAVAAVVYAYRVLEVGDIWRAERAIHFIDHLSGRLEGLQSTGHPRTDRQHLAQSMMMARWQLCVQTLDADGLFRTVVEAALRARDLVDPVALHSYNGCRMMLVAAFLLSKIGQVDAALRFCAAGARLFEAAMANEASSPNRAWDIPPFEIEDTRKVVERMGVFAQAWRRGEDLDEQDAVIMSATRLLETESREAIRKNFALLTDRIAKSGRDLLSDSQRESIMGGDA